MRDTVKGFIYSLIAVIFLSTNFITAKFGLTGFNPETFSLVWTVFATCYSFIIALTSPESRKQLFFSNNIVPLIILGIITGITMLLSWSALSVLDPVFSSFLWRLFPVITVISGVIFLKEKLMRDEIIAIIIMFLGSIVSIKGEWNIVGKGVILTLLAECAGAIQLIIAKTYVNRIHPNIMVLYRVAIASIFISIYAIASHKIDFNVRISCWYITMLGAFLGPCASFLFLFRSYKYWELSKSSILLILQPILVFPMAYLFLGTVPNIKEFIGGLIILIGAFWLAFIQIKK